MHPIFFHLGPLTIHWYGVMMALGFLAGLVNWHFAGRARGWDIKFSSDLLLWIMSSGIVGGRLAYVASEWGYFAGHPFKMLRVDEGGLIYYGGFIGAVIAIGIFARTRGESIVRVCDFAGTSLPLAHAFGRIGCFLNGCCHGVVTKSWIGVCFPAESLAWREHLAERRINALASRSLPVHPVQLYEVVLDLALFGVLWAVYRRRPRDGRVAGLYLLLYPAGRFCLEFIRGDERMRWASLSVAQWFSVALFMAGLWLVFGYGRQAETPAAPRAKPEGLK